MHRRSADCASTVKWCAFKSTIDLNSVPDLLCILVRAKNFKSSRINWIPFPWLQFTVITCDLSLGLSPLYIFCKKSFTSVNLPVPEGPWKIMCGILFTAMNRSSFSKICECIGRRVLGTRISDLVGFDKVSKVCRRFAEDSAGSSSQYVWKDKRDIMMGCIHAFIRFWCRVNKKQVYQ